MSDFTGNAGRLAENPACNPVCRVCHYKKLEYPEQLQRKRTWALEQLGNWNLVLREIRPAPISERIAYRSKSWMRSSFQGGVLSFGMLRAVWRDGDWEKEFIAWDTCPLHVIPMQTLITNLRTFFASEIPAFIEKELVGVWLGSPHLVVVSSGRNSEVLKQLDWSRILVPPFDRVWFHCNPQVGRKIFSHHEIEPIVGSSAGAAPPIRAFRQVAQSLLSEARDLAVRTLMQNSPAMVLDLYCGTGDLSLLLPKHTGWLGIELSSEAVKFANSLRNSGGVLHSAFVGTVEHRLRDPVVLKKISGSYALYVNPPRSGMSEEAGEAVRALLRDQSPESVAYLSCSASSLARDLGLFEKEGYRVELLQPYDFFPQTEHFETLAILRKC